MKILNRVQPNRFVDDFIDQDFIICLGKEKGGITILGR